MLVTSGAMAKPMDLVSAVSMTRKELTVDKQITRYSKVESWEAVYLALWNYAEEVVSRPYFFVPVGVWSRGGGNFVYSDEARLDSPSPFNQETVGRVRFLPRTDAIPGWFELRFTSYRNRKDGTGEWLREFEGFRDGALEEMERLGYELRARVPKVVEQNALLQTTGPEKTKSTEFTEFEQHVIDTVTYLRKKRKKPTNPEVAERMQQEGIGHQYNLEPTSYSEDWIARTRRKLRKRGVDV